MFKKRKKNLEDEQILNDLLSEDEARELESKESLIDLIFEKDLLEDEMSEFLTDKEKDELRIQKKEEKRLMFIVFSVLGFIVMGLIIFFIIFTYVIKSDLEKYVVPLIEQFYKEKYNNETSVKNIDYICEDGKCSKIILAYMDDNSYCISLDGKSFYTDNGYSSKVEEAKKYINDIVGKDNVINTNLYLSYQDFHMSYNIYLDYVKVLPDMTIDQLVDTNKLEVTGTILYQNDINIKELKKLLKKLGKNSKFYLIQKKAYNPYKLTVISLEEELEFIFKNNNEVYEGVVNFNIGVEKTGIEELTINKLNASNVTFSEYKEIKNGYSIKLDKEYVKKDEEEKPSYYFIKFNKSRISKNNLLFFESSYGNIHREMKKEDIPEIIMSDNGEDVYVIGNESIGFANQVISDKTSIWCKIGLC